MEPLNLVTRLSVAVATVLLSYLYFQVFYNLYLHPLSKIPGPKIWAAFRSRHVFSLWRGRLVYEVYDLHQMYGDIVRIAPDEVSFSNPQAWDDIYCHRPGHKPFLKDPVWWGEVPGRAETIVSAATWENHERLRRILGHCFTDAALRAEESIIQKHVSKLINELTKKIEASKKGATVVNIVDWFMFTTFDIIGDLSFGSTFGCLETSAYHPWVLEIFSYFKLGALFSTLKFYPLIQAIFVLCLPKKMVQSQERNYQWSCKKVHARLNFETQREDFMDKILPYVRQDEEEAVAEDGMRMKKLSIAELENNFYVLTVAGSETCGTVLSGITNYLVKTPRVLHKLAKEVRDSFEIPSQMTFDSLSKLPYLNAVIEEGCRLSPPVGGALAHVVPEGGDTVCAVWLPGGTHVGLHQWSASRSPSKFHNPSTFAPERWLPSSSSDPSSPYHQDQRDGVQAFSKGSWSCIGKNLGMAELRLILARMVFEFDLERGEGKGVEWGSQKQYVLIEKEPFEIKISLRREVDG